MNLAPSHRQTPRAAGFHLRIRVLVAAARRVVLEKIGARVAGAAFLAAGLLALTSGCGPSDKSGTRSTRAADPSAQAMAALRGQFLKASLSDLGVAKHTNLVRVGGVLVDWPMEHATVSVVALVDGSASLYTTGPYGILGGGGHEAVRAAASRCVRAADKLYDSATSTSDHSLPGTNQVRIFLQGREGLRSVTAETASLASGKDSRTELWNEVQVLIGELRLTEEESQGGKTRPR